MPVLEAALPPAAPPRDRARLVWGCLAIAVVVAVAYGGVARAGFVAFDDDEYVYANPMVRQGLTWESLRWAFAGASGRAYFHPLTWLSLMLDAQLFGLDPRAFHAVNLLLHLATALLLFAFLDRTTGRAPAALLAALLFAAHPLNVEAVAWVTERKAVLSSALGMGALLAWEGWTRRRGAGRYAAACALLVASLLAKPGLVVLPALLLLLDLWPLRRLGPLAGARDWWRAVSEKVPLLLLAGGVALGVLESTAPFSSAPGEGASAAQRATTALAAVAHYLRAAVWPTGLAFYHPPPASPPAGGALAGVGAIAGISLLAWRLAPRRPWLLVGWGWFLVALVPYLGLVQNGLWPAWAERFAYFPLAGLAVAVAFAAAEAVGEGRRLALLGVGLLAPLVLVTRAQVDTWRDSLSLFARGVAVEPAAFLPRFALGQELLRTGKAAEAEAELRRAVELVPAAGRAHGALAKALLAQGREVEAEAELREALALEPEDPLLLLALGDLLWRAGRREEARPLLEEFLRRAPPYMAPDRAGVAARLGIRLD